MVKIVVTGAEGRMGSGIIRNALIDREVNLVGAVEAKGNSAIGKDLAEKGATRFKGVKITDDLVQVLSHGDVLIDFSHFEATLPNLEIVARLKKAAVVGTTGHTPDQKKAIEKMGQQIPLVFSPNMSVGVNALLKLIPEIVKILGPRIIGPLFKVKIKEIHHKHKIDKPSGTALKIAEVLAPALGVNDINQIPIESIREGEVVGDHSVIFESLPEVLEITHKAKLRDTFAVGALVAAKWIVGKPKGLYSMKDVLGL